MTRGLSWNDLHLQEVVGEGHSGRVFRAQLKAAAAGLDAGSAVAVKRYKAWVLEEAGQIDRIFREIDIGRRVSHKNVARVLGGVLDDHGRPALIMEFCEGPTLESVIRFHREHHSVIPIAQAFSLSRDLALAVATLHTAGVTHRDVKPANIILTERGPVLTDFGVVRSSDLPEQTTTGAFMGTIRYGAPEYLFGEDYDSSIDVYGFGAIVYEMFTSRLLFGKHGHWARIVSAKISSKGYGQHDLDLIAKEHGWNTASFVRKVLRHSLGKRPERTLDLASLAQAIDARLWCQSFQFEDGRFSGGTNLFEGPMHTADEAAIAVRTRLQEEDIIEIREVLRERSWALIVPGGSFSKDLTRRLVHAGMARRDPRAA